MQELFDVGAHYGYSRSRRHPSMTSAVFGRKNKVEIIDLEKTIEALEEALSFVRSLGKEGKQILFVGSKAEAKEGVKDIAISLGQPYVTERWIGGTLTNYSEIKKRVARLEKLEEEAEKGELGVYTKKEQLLFEREMEKLRTYFGGIRGMKGEPQAMFIVDPKHQIIAVKEAQKRNIPIISIQNTDCNRADVTYPIPANDSSKQTIGYITEKIAQAYQEGAKEETVS